MRLIDADALKRKEQKIATETWKMKVKASVESILNQFIDHIDHAPTVDVVPVVRCKDCKEWDEENHWCNIRDSYGWDYKPNDYCSYGVRKTEDDDLQMCANHYGERREG